MASVSRAKGTVKDEEFMQSRSSIYDVSSKRFCIYFLLYEKRGVGSRVGNGDGWGEGD